MAGDLCAVILQTASLTLENTTVISVCLSMHYFIYFKHNPIVSYLCAILSNPHEQGVPYSKTNVTIALIMDCPTITVHAEKQHKVLIDSGAAISLVRYSTYQNTDNNLKTAVQSTLIHLNTVD